MKREIYHRTIGTGRLVIMLHGYGLDHRSLLGCMEPIFRRYKGFKRIYLDLPAMGISPALGVKSSKDILDRVLKFVSDVAPETKLILVGYSYGGYLAQHIALRRPDLIDGMLLIAPVIFADLSKRNLPKHKVFVKRYPVNRLKGQDEIDVFNDLAIQTFAVWKNVKRYILSGYLVRNASLLDHVQQRAYPIPGNIINLGRKIAAPVTIITGKHDNMVGYADSKTILGNYLNGKHVTLARAGHALQFEQPAIFRSAVEKWIDDLQF